MRAGVAILTCALLAVSCLQPRKWPIPELSVPASAPPARIPGAMIEDDWRPFLSGDGSRTEEGPNVYSWARGFYYAQGWDALVRHVERALTPLGYKPYSGRELAQIPQIPGVPAGTLARAWLSPDGMYLVFLVNVAYIKDNDAGEIGSHEADFVLAIDQMKDLPPQLQEQMDRGG